MQDALAEDGSGQLVGERAGEERVEAEHREDAPGGKPAAVVIAADAHEVVAPPDLEQLARAQLRLPGNADAVEDVRDVERGFVAHRVLSDEPRGIGLEFVEVPDVARRGDVEERVEPRFGGAGAAERCDDERQIVRRAPCVDVAVVFRVVVAGALAAAEGVVDGLNPPPVAVLRVVIPGIGFPEVAVGAGERTEEGFVPFAPEFGRQLRAAPEVVREVEHGGDGLAALAGIHFGNGFPFAGAKRREEAVLPEKGVERIGRTLDPGDERARLKRAAQRVEPCGYAVHRGRLNQAEHGQ